MCAMQAMPATAQTAERVRMGYCDDKIGGGLVAQTDQPAEFGAAIRLPNSTLQKYAGAKLSEIDFAVGGRVGEMMTIIITRELGGKPIYTQNYYDMAAGWNKVTLKKPYTIKANDDLYVGYIFYCNANDVNEEVIKFEYDPGLTSGMNYISQDNHWMATPESIDFDLCIHAYAEGPDLPHTDVGIVSLTGSDIIRQNSSSKFKFKIKNFGVDEVNHINLELIANGDIFSQQSLSDISLPNNHEIELNIDDLKFPEEGNNELTVRICDVNHTQDSDASDNEHSKPIYAVREQGQPVPRQVLFEEFTTETDELSITADSIYSSSQELSDKAIWVKHHTDDPYELPWESPYALFFDNHRMFHPAIMTDRTTFGGMKEQGPAYFLSTADEVDVLIEACHNTPSFITPSVEHQYDASTGKLHLTVNGRAEVKEMPFQTDLRLTVYIVEDHVHTLTQKGASEYFHNGIIRTTPCDNCFGDPIAITDYSFTKEYTVNIPHEWNPDHLRIVAFVSNYDARDSSKQWIYNATEQNILTSSISSPEHSGHRPPVVYTSQGNLIVEPGYHLLGIYHLSGTQVSSSHLEAGFYLVRTTDGSNVYTSKIAVR